MCEHNHILTPETCSICIEKKNTEERSVVKSAFEELRDDANNKVKKVDNKWAEHEVQYLRDNINKMSNREMGEYMGRTAAAVGFRLSSEGIKRDKKNKPKKIKTKKNSSHGFDANTLYLGKLCGRRHKYQDTGQSLRRIHNRTCDECNKLQQSTHKLTLNFADHTDLLDELKELAKEQLRTVENQALWMLKAVQEHGEKLEKSDESDSG